MRDRRSFSVLATVAVLVAGCATTAPTRPADLTQLGVVDAARLIRSGQVTSVELTQAYLDRAATLTALNAFVTLDPAKALDAARKADAERAAGRGTGALHGVPLVVKDNIHVAGLPNTAGTPGLRDFVPSANAPVVQKLVDAGAVVLGKTNMHELAFGISGYNEAFHQTRPIGVRNPYDHTRFAGGSSSGTGAAIGGRLAPGGLGSDTGGSVRIPAAMCGIVGFRPSLRRYSQEGITPIAHTRDTAGPMAQTVADVALLDAVLTGEAPVTPISLKGARFGVYRPYFFAALDADTKAVIDRALDRLAAAGAVIVDVDMPQLKPLNDRVSFPVAVHEAYDDMAAYLRRWSIPKTVEQLASTIASKDVKATYDGLVVPRKIPAPTGMVDAKPAYEAALREGRPGLQHMYIDTFAKHRLDALIFPTTPRIAAKQGPEASSLETFLLYIRNTDPGSNAGIPGLSIPAGRGPSGLPVGLEIDILQGSDRRLLSFGLAIEEALGRLPPP
jgi:mandelamide amidase